MKRITAITLFAIASFVMAGKSFAQEHEIQATVPFDFAVGNKVLPSGTYTIRSESTNVIVVRNRDTSVGTLSLALTDGKECKNGGKLIFNKYGDQYFLSEILSSSTAMSLMIPRSKLEQRVRLQEARLNTSNQVFVASR
jgi:hypothetical protein